MADIVERLRKLADRESPYGSLPDVLDEAADEITALRAALSTTRAAALEEAARVAEAKGDEWTKEWRAALKCSSYLEGMSDGTDDVAAAIRALIKHD